MVTPINVRLYKYAATGWKDRLISYDGYGITYDTQGNPLIYRGHTLEWSRIRLLTKWDDIEIDYDASGIRTRKGDTTYELDGSSIISETTNGNTIRYYYGNGGIVGFRYNGQRYYYEKNLQGDIIAIYDTDGNLVGAYIYDAWGNCTITTDIDGIAMVNPFRYCSYYYDSETGLYYVASRYYDPVIGRWINADDVDLLGANGDFASYNLFAYCGNNPVIRRDPSGYAWETIWDAISLVAGVAEVAANPYDPWAWIGLVGDAADVLIPFVGGIGETTRALKAASQAAEIIDAASDAKKGWKVGEDITNLTQAGNTPSWSTLRSRYWKNKAHYFANDPLYQPEDIARMKKGLAPQIIEDGELRSMELHHILGREDNYYYFFFEITPKGHAQVDPFRYLK